MEIVRLAAHVRAQMIAHALKEAPNECCGLLVGSGDVIDECVGAENVDPNPTVRYRVDPAQHIAVHRRLRESNRQLLGSYHSHPRTPAIPSPSDRAEVFYPEFLWLIVSLVDPARPALAAYRLLPDGVRAVTIVDLSEHAPMNIIDSIKDEYLRYKALAEGAIKQVPDAALTAAGPTGGLSIATICWHVSGNLQSRFTDFLTSDGEKPWRKREEEFESRTVTRAELLQKWEQGWSVLLASLAALSNDHLTDAVIIRGQSMKVHEALHRSLAHTSYHVGQIVYLAKAACGTDWTYLSIPPGQSDRYNQNPGSEKPAAHAKVIEGSR
jgi:proteasome lid subunit RPN8/RPN11